MSDRFLTAAGHAAAVALSARLGVPVLPDTTLDIRETPTGLVHFVVGLLGVQPAGRYKVPVPRPWLGLRADLSDRLELEVREVTTYRFTALEEPLRRSRAGGPVGDDTPPQRGDQ